MPTYEYECTQCAHRFEKFQPITTEPIKICPVCQGTVRRLIGGGSGIIFKGSGFYQTDYRSSAYQKKADADKKPVKKSDSKTPPPASPSTPSKDKS